MFADEEEVLRVLDTRTNTSTIYFLNHLGIENGIFARSKGGRGFEANAAFDRALSPLAAKVFVRVGLTSANADLFWSLKASISKHCLLKAVSGVKFS